MENKPKEINNLTEFLKLCTVIDVDSNTASHYGELMAILYKKGKPIPTNDIWIAAAARQYGVRLITRDKHFRELDNLEIDFW